MTNSRFLNKKGYRLVLASSSPRRTELMGVLGLEFETVSPDIDETPAKGEKPRDYARRMARDKAAKVRDAHAGSVIICVDNVVAMGSRIIDKAETDEDVYRSISMLKGRRSHVYSALCVVTPDGRMIERMTDNIVIMKNLSEEEIRDYVASGEGIGKAGGYAIQGLGGTFIRKIIGSHSAIVGLSLYDLAQVLKGI